MDPMQLGSSQPADPWWTGCLRLAHRMRPRRTRLAHRARLGAEWMRFGSPASESSRLVRVAAARRQHVAQRSGCDSQRANAARSGCSRCSWHRAVPGGRHDASRRCNTTTQHARGMRHCRTGSAALCGGEGDQRHDQCGSTSRRKDGRERQGQTLGWRIR